MLGGKGGWLEKAWLGGFVDRFIHVHCIGMFCWSFVAIKGRKKGYLKSSLSTRWVIGCTNIGSWDISILGCSILTYTCTNTLLFEITCHPDNEVKKTLLVYLDTYLPTD